MNNKIQNPQDQQINSQIEPKPQKLTKQKEQMAKADKILMKPQIKFQNKIPKELALPDQIQKKLTKKKPKQKKKTNQIEKPQINEEQKQAQKPQKTQKQKPKYKQKHKIIQKKLPDEVILEIKVKNKNLIKIREQIDLLYQTTKQIESQMTKLEIENKQTTQQYQLKSEQLLQVDQEIAEQSAQSHKIVIDIIMWSLYKKQIKIDLHGFRCKEIKLLFEKIKLLNKKLKIGFNVGAGNHTDPKDKINGKAPLRVEIQKQCYLSKLELTQRYDYLMLVQFKRQKKR